MGWPIRDDRQMQALTGLSQAQLHHWLPVFSDSCQATQQQTDEEGLTSGMRVRQPGGGGTGQWPTMAEQRLCVLSDSKPSPTFDVLGPPFAMVRSKANENLPKLSPLFYDTLGY